MAPALASLLLLAGLTAVQAQNVSTYSFLSRPDITAPVLDVITYNPALTGSGYIFLTPSSPGVTNFSVGPKIYNNKGVSCDQIRERT